MKKKLKKTKLYSNLSWAGFDLEVDNGTLSVSVPTPKGWKCKCKGCKIDWKHGHSTYSSLINGK